MFYNGGIKLINEKMEKIKITIKNVIYEFFPPYYLNYVFSGKSHWMILLKLLRKWIKRMLSLNQT